MRTFTIRRGKYQGEHAIFESIKEATEHKIVDIKSPWWQPEVDPGDWVVSDDGYVVQCLERRKLVNKRHRNGQFTDVFTFPQGIAWVYYDKSGNKNIKNFYAALTNNNRTSLGNTSALGKYMTAKKKLFVEYVKGGLDPYHAYIKAYNVGTSTRQAIFAQINKLLNDKNVKEELMQALQPFMDKVQKGIEERTGHTEIVDFVVEQILDLVTEKKLSQKDMRENLKFLIALLGDRAGIIAPEKPSKDKREVENADYEEIAPPPLTE